jgi:hypothetical protein
MEEYATWCLLVTQARDKNYVEHTSDSVIDIAVRYFAGQEDPHRKAHAYYCKGRVLSDLDFSEEALEAYLKAKEFVQETTDYPLQARICNHLGTLYWENFDKLNRKEIFVSLANSSRALSILFVTILSKFVGGKTPSLVITIEL